MSTQKLRVKSLSGQAKEAILQYIEEMDLKTDNKLPREEALAEMLGVSRITIRQALNDLAAEGIIFRRQGRGTFVNVDSLNIKVTFSPCMELTQMIKKSGYAPSVRLLNRYSESGRNCRIKKICICERTGFKSISLPEDIKLQ